LTIVAVRKLFKPVKIQYRQLLSKNNKQYKPDHRAERCR